MSFAPLDPDEYKRQAVLLKALHCAHPVSIEGKVGFLHTLTVSQAGGRIEMQAYLAGRAEPVKVEEIALQTQPEN